MANKTLLPFLTILFTFAAPIHANVQITEVHDQSSLPLRRTDQHITALPHANQPGDKNESLSHIQTTSMLQEEFNKSARSLAERMEKTAWEL